MKRLILFDFDGTLTTQDSMLKLFRYRNGDFKYLLGFLIHFPFLVMMQFGFVSSKRAKEKLLAFHFSGLSIDEFNSYCKSFAEEVIPYIVRSNAMEKIHEYQKTGDRVVVITASLENWVKPWTDQIGIELIGTRLKKESGLFDGKIGKNCKGLEKVNRLKTYLDIISYDEIIAFGDTRGDREMLELADKSYYRYF
ncbi:MAG: HAD family hydrolase [Cyclobacteriaceae bacterium]